MAHEGGPVNLEQAEPQTAGFQVNINKAQWPELATLPGVGTEPGRADRAVAEQNGPYADIDDLRRVRGIGARTVETLRPYLRPMPRREAVAGK